MYILASFAIFHCILFCKLYIFKFLVFVLVLQNRKHFHHYQHLTFEFNIFCNLTYRTKSISDNLLSRVSKHLSQEPIFPEFLSRSSPLKFNKHTHDCKTFHEERFMSEFNSQDWDKMLDLDKGNVTERVNNYLQNINNIM